MHDLLNDNEYLWERNKFLNRQSHMQEMYRELEETGQIPTLAKVGGTNHYMKLNSLKTLQFFTYETI